jgi:hypothetical protein
VGVVGLRTKRQLEDIVAQRSLASHAEQALFIFTGTILLMMYVDIFTSMTHSAAKREPHDRYFQQRTLHCLC